MGEIGSVPFASVLTILGIAFALAVQSWIWIRWLNREFKARDEALSAAIHDRNRELQNVVGKIDTTREYSRAEIARIDRDLSGLRERLAQMPTRTDMENILRDRVFPVESNLTALAMQLARLGLVEAQNKIMMGRID